MVGISYIYYLINGFDKWMLLVIHHTWTLVLVWRIWVYVSAMSFIVEDLGDINFWFVYYYNLSFLKVLLL